MYRQLEWNVTGEPRDFNPPEHFDSSMNPYRMLLSTKLEGKMPVSYPYVQQFIRVPHQFHVSEGTRMTTIPDCETKSPLLQHYIDKTQDYPNKRYLQQSSYPTNNKNESFDDPVTPPINRHTKKRCRKKYLNSKYPLDQEGSPKPYKHLQWMLDSSKHDQQKSNALTCSISLPLDSLTSLPLSSSNNNEVNCSNFPSLNTHPLPGSNTNIITCSTSTLSTCSTSTLSTSSTFNRLTSTFGLNSLRSTSPASRYDLTLTLEETNKTTNQQTYWHPSQYSTNSIYHEQNQRSQLLREFPVRNSIASTHDANDSITDGNSSKDRHARKFIHSFPQEQDRHSMMLEVLGSISQNHAILQQHDISHEEHVMTTQSQSILQKRISLNHSSQQKQSILYNNPPHPLNHKMGYKDSSFALENFRERRRCIIVGCRSNAVSKGLCKSHGGGQRCKADGCPKSAQRSGLCYTHGGKNTCVVEGCASSSVSRGRCKAHGGGRRCRTYGCSNSAVSRSFCYAHGGGTQCSKSGCLRSAKLGGLCYSHGGRRICEIEGCDMNVINRKRCRKHGVDCEQADNDNRKNMVSELAFSGSDRSYSGDNTSSFSNQQETNICKVKSTNQDNYNDKLAPSLGMKFVLH